MPRQSSRLHGPETESQSKTKPTILGIPTETRLYIFEYLYSITKTTTDYGDCVCHNSETDECALINSRRSNEFCGYAALFLTCRTFYHEAVDLLYRPITHLETKGVMPHLLVSADDVELSNFPGMFCRKHLEYRNGTASIFRRINTLSINVIGTLEPETGCACCGKWPVLADEESRPAPFGFDDKNQAMDNVRWLADQMSHSTGINILSISVGWSDDGFDKYPDLEDSALLLKPFKALRNVNELEFVTLSTTPEQEQDEYGLEVDTIGEWKQVVHYKKRMREILGSNAPVTENPIPLTAWLDFKRTVKRLMTFAPQVAAHIHLNAAALAVGDQGSLAFRKALTDLRKAWRDEMKQREKIELRVSNLRNVKLLDIPYGKRKEDDPEEVEFSVFDWSDPNIEGSDRRAYIGFLEGFDD